MSLAARSPPLAPPPASLHSPSRLCCPSRSHALATRCRATADVLLVDAQNVLSRAGAGNGGHRLPGEGVAGSFADWLSFLAAVAEPQLVVAVFDAPRSQRGAQEREQLAPQYLQRRKRRQGQAAASAGTQAGEAAASAVATAQRPGGDPLRPFKQRVQQLGGVCLQAAPGWEADDGIAAACAAVQERRPLARLLVASGDQDMQQLLAQQVAWLRLHSQTSLACPLGLELVTAEDFEQQHGFPASAYPDWLALVGKREASIRGADVGARTAAKLLARYGSLEGVLAAAAAGQLKGWGPAVQQFLAGSGNSKGGSSSSADGGISSQREALLRRNMRLFAANSDPSVVEPRGMQQLLAALERLGPAESAGAAAAEQRTWESSSCRPPELAWLQPMFARRWRHLLQLAADAAQSSSNNDAWLPGQQATPQGLAVDELRGPEADQAGSSGTAVFYVCPIDVAAGGWNKALSAASTAPQGGDLTAALMPLLSGPMRHHVRLVQRAGFRVELRLPPTVL